MRSVELAPVELPEFGLPTVEPRIPAEVYERRIQAAMAYNILPNPQDADALASPPGQTYLRRGQPAVPD